VEAFADLFPRTINGAITIAQIWYDTHIPESTRYRWHAHWKLNGSCRPWDPQAHAKHD
jgi:hypothetical protein